MRYRAKPCEIEAMQWTGKFDRNISLFVGKDATIRGLDEPFQMTIHSLEGDMVVSVGDYIIRGLCGELFCCKPDIFHRKYEAVISDA